MRWRGKRRAEQSQRGGKDSTNLQAARDLTIYEGASVEEVRAIALDVFRANFVELRGVAEEVALGRAQKLTQDYLDALEERNPAGLGTASDPDMQRAIFEAQKEYACSGDDDLETVLVDLLVDRAGETVRETRTIVLNEAISAAPKLTEPQRRAIAVCFLVKYARWIGPPVVDAYYQKFIRENLLPLSEDVPTKQSSYQHIEYVGAGAVGIGSHTLGAALKVSAAGYFTHGVAATDLPVELQPLVSELGFFIPALRDPEHKIQLNAMHSSDVDELVNRLENPELGPLLRNVFDTSAFNESEVEDDILSHVPEVAPFFTSWQHSALPNLTLTSVGIAIGHGYWRRVTGGDAPLSIWISD